MKKYIFITLLCIASSGISAQEVGVHKGLLRMATTFSTGYLTKGNSTEIFLHSDLEYFVDSAISVRSDSYIYLDAMGKNDIFNINHSLFSGALYHFTKGSQFDPYIGFQPGISYSQLNDAAYPGRRYITAPVQSKATYNPLVSGLVGFNYYAPRFFHLFMNARYVTGTHLTDSRGPRSLNEIRFSFGLGINFR